MNFKLKGKTTMGNPDNLFSGQTLLVDGGATAV